MAVVVLRDVRGELRRRRRHVHPARRGRLAAHGIGAERAGAEAERVGGIGRVVGGTLGLQGIWQIGVVGHVALVRPVGRVAGAVHHVCVAFVGWMDAPVAIEVQRRGAV